MTAQQPIYLSQGVNYLGFLSQQLGDLSGIATLAHELIQNADDAKDDDGILTATRITFDVTDTALIVSNDAVFREIDFERMRDVASGSKRGESGDRTTGSFGVGFISVYQVTDRPEIHSAGRIWILMPDNPREKRIEQRIDPSITVERGTVFRLPWAFEESSVRRALKVPAVSTEYIESFVDILSESLPKAILFLKKLERIELLRNGEAVGVVIRRVSDDLVRVTQDGDVRYWRVFDANFSDEATRLKARYKDSIDQRRSDRIRVAIPDSLIDDGLLFATLPTEQSTKLPFHIDADFYPASDRRSIEFGDTHDPRSEWNRSAVRAAALAVESNLLHLRDLYGNNASTLWDFLSSIHEVHRVTENDTRLPLSAFWKSLLPALARSPIVYTESGKWLVPKLARIPTGPQEENAVRAFQDIGIEIVHRDLWNSRNLLTRGDIGVGRVRASDIHHHLKSRGYVNGPMSSLPVDSVPLDVLWRGIEGVLAKEQGRSKKTAQDLLKACALAPGLDGCLWPCRSAFRSDKRTRERFAPLISNDGTFLAREGIPLLDQLCPEFTVSDALEVLAALDAGQLAERRRDGAFNPVAVLQWFEEHRAELTADLRAQLASLPIFPSASSLRPLPELWLPGGFEDSLGVARILDAKILDSLSSFLRYLGVRQLTFADYAEHYISGAFAKGSSVDADTKRKLLATLDRHIGEIKGRDAVKKTLSLAWIVECRDDVFRQPRTAYFRNEEVSAILGDRADYAIVPDDSPLRRDLYQWLGVQSRPRITDMIWIVDQATATKPTHVARSTVVKTLGALGLRFLRFGASDKSSCLKLKTMAWLPSEADASRWYRPNELYAAYNKTLFASQARFLDAPIRIQQNVRGILAWLGVNLSPRPFQVVRHLIRCSEMDAEPPAGIYDWLNGNATSGELRELVTRPCLWFQGRYLRPDEVFWGSHPFGNHRAQLGPDLVRYQNLLEGLGVREKPDSNDAIAVLKDIFREAGRGVLRERDKNVVTQCWIMLSDAVDTEVLDAGSLSRRLRDVPCVPTNQGHLHRPSWMFFEDRSGLVDKFSEILEQNCIRRTERAWVAMKAAGVRLVSDIVSGYVEAYENPRESDEVTNRVAGRVSLIRTILEGATTTAQEGDRTSILDGIRFFHVDHLTIRWRLRAFNRDWPDTPPEVASAHWDSEELAVFFATREDGTTPWTAIARELTLALVPGENPAPIAPGLKSVLEAGSASDAEAQLSELGIASIHGFDGDPVEGSVVDSLGGAEAGITTEDHSGNGMPDGPGNNYEPDGLDNPDDWFAQQLHSVQTTTPSSGRDNPIVLPPGGPNTAQSARTYLARTRRVGRHERHELRLVRRYELGPQGRALEDEFRSMVEGDYGKRCQICTRTFVTTGGGWLVNVVHVVPPREGYLTNHFGDLLGLCGWHFNLLRYGEWALLDPDTARPFEDMDGTRGWERMRTFILNRAQDTDELGNPFVALPVRFTNVYLEWQSEPTPLNEEIRYSLPHWEFLCRLLSV